MATAIDRSELHGAEIVDQVLLIPTDQIDEGERLRPVDPIWAEALGQMMRRDGQKKDLEVCRLPGANRWTLVDGAHRLAGARGSNIVYLRALVVSADRHERRLREIMAQLGHRGLTNPVDRAAFVAELVQLKRAQAGLATVAGRDAMVKAHLRKAVKTETGETMETISMVYGFSDQVGAELGLTGRTIRNDLMIYRGVAPSLIAKLREVRHPVLRNAAQLQLLAKLDAAEQGCTVEVLLSYPALTSIGQARAQLGAGKPALNAEAKRLSAFIGSFQRMTLTERKGALAQLAPMLPAGFALTTPGHDLRAMAAMVRDWTDQGLDADWIVGKLQDEHGAVLRFANGTDELKLCKVTATCTAGGQGLVNAWLRAAIRRMAVEQGA